MSEINQIIKKGEKSEIRNEIKDAFSPKQNIQRNYDRINDSATQYLQAYAELQAGLEKIKSLISEPGILSANLKEQYHKELRELTNTNSKSFESKFELKNIPIQHQIKKEEVAKMTKEHEQTFDKLNELAPQPELFDNEYREKISESSEPQISFDESMLNETKIKKSKDTSKIQSKSSQDLSSKDSNSEADVLQIYAQGISNYLNWLNNMVFSYYQSVNDLNNILQSQVQIANAEISLKKNLKNLWGLDFSFFETSENQLTKQDTHGFTKERNEKSLGDVSVDYFNIFSQSAQNMTDLGTKFLESWYPFLKTNQNKK